MIIKASQRAGAAALAAHLNNGHDNEHVTLHDVRGFLGTSIHDALIESEAVSQATKCRQHLFSVSLSPPPDKQVSTSLFEDTANRIEKKMGLEGQPRIMVFHEKQGRRHCHVVWSRIDVLQLKAVNLPYFKNRLMEISKSLYLENDWDLPQGHIDKRLSNPLNYTLAEWQQAKRQKRDPKAIKQILRECWQNTNTKSQFETALNERGYYLACGQPRRSFVVIDWMGRVRSLSRQSGASKDELNERLGDASNFLSVEEATSKINAQLKQNLQTHLAQLLQHHKTHSAHIDKQKTDMTKAHHAARQKLAREQETKRIELAKERQKEFLTGIKGLWQRVTGQRWRINKKHEQDALLAHQRNKAEMDQLILRQLQERQELQTLIDAQNHTLQQNIHQLQLSVISQIGKEQTQQMTQIFKQSRDWHL